MSNEILRGETKKCFCLLCPLTSSLMGFTFSDGKTCASTCAAGDLAQDTSQLSLNLWGGKKKSLSLLIIPQT